MSWAADYWFEMAEIEDEAARPEVSEERPSRHSTPGKVCPSCKRRHFFLDDCGNDSEGAAE